jgi:hypothetical protein
MKFDFLKETPKELNTNVWNTFGVIGKKKFFVSYENEIVLLYNDIMSREEEEMTSLYQRYDFLKAIRERASANLAEANVSIGTIREIVDSRFEEYGTFDGSRLIDPKFTVGTGLCGYAFVQKDNKIYLSVPSRQLCVVEELCEAKKTGWSPRTIDLKGALLLLEAFRDCKEVKISYNGSYLKFEGNGKAAFIKVKSYNGSYNKHPEAFKIISSYTKRDLNKDVIAAAIGEYKYDDFMNTNVERIANTAYSFHIDSDKMDAVFEDNDFSTKSYLNHGREAASEINFVSSFEVLETLLKIFDEDLQIISNYDPEKHIDGVDPNWWDINYAFFTSAQKPYLAAYIV